MHFPIDSVAGRMLGETLAGYVEFRCNAAKDAKPGWVPHTFDGTKTVKFSSDGLSDKDQPIDHVAMGLFDPHEPLNAKAIVPPNSSKLPPYFHANKGKLEDPRRPTGLAAGSSAGLLADLWSRATQEWQ